MRTFSPGRLAATAVAATAATAAVAAPAGTVSASTVSASTVSASTVPAAAAAWRISLTVPGTGFPTFTAVAATGAASAWAFETAGTRPPAAYQLSGSTWTRRAFPARRGDSVISATASSAANVWAFTVKGQALRFNGHVWSAVKTFGKPVSSGVAVGSSDVWVFGSGGTQHYNGHSWTTVASGRGLLGASALSAASIWAYGATGVAHWNGSTWRRTSLASLLPRNTQLSHSHLAGIYAASATSVYVAASGGRQDEGGPLVLLHGNGHGWSKLAQVKSLGDPVAIAGDGSGGVWIPVRTGFPGNGSMEHYAHGALSAVTLPVSPAHLLLWTAAAARHTTAALAVGYMRKSFSATTTTAIILRFGT